MVLTTDTRFGPYSQSIASVSLPPPVLPQCHQSPPLCQHMRSAEASDCKGYREVAVSAYLAADTRSCCAPLKLSLRQELSLAHLVTGAKAAAVVRISLSPAWRL